MFQVQSRVAYVVFVAYDSIEQIIFFVLEDPNRNCIHTKKYYTTTTYTASHSASHTTAHYTRKYQGRVSPNLKNIPIYAVMVENLGERGAQYTALKLLQDVDRRRYSSKRAVEAATAAAAQASADASSKSNVQDTAVRGAGVKREEKGSEKGCGKGVCGGSTETVLMFAFAVGLITLGGYVYANKKK